MKDNQNEGLKRELGIWDVATNVINISIASGIFLLPALMVWNGYLVSAALINGIADILSIPFPIFSLPIYRGLLFFL